MNDLCNFFIIYFTVVSKDLGLTYAEFNLLLAFLYPSLLVANYISSIINSETKFKRAIKKAVKYATGVFLITQVCLAIHMFMYFNFLALVVREGDLNPKHAHFFQHQVEPSGTNKLLPWSDN